MISSRVRGLTMLHGIVQTMIVVAVFWIWVAFIFCFIRRTDFALDRYVIYSAVIVIAMGLDITRGNLARSNLLHLDIVRNHQRTLRQTSVVIGALLLFLVAFKDLVISRAFLFSLVPFLYLTIFATNRWLPRFLARSVFDRRHRVRTVLYGDPKMAENLRPWLERKYSYGIHVDGLVTDAPREDVPAGMPILGKCDELESILRETKPSKLIVLEMPSSTEFMANMNDLCDRCGVRLFVVNDLEDKLRRQVSMIDDDGFHFVAFRQEPMECPLGRLTKRALDVALALPVVLFLLPTVSLMVHILHRRQAPGPLFFRQKRTGKHNAEFSIYKYRTMILGDFDEAQQATQDDPRIFSAGKWLRRLSIDELPQFINVLRGEMSIVGPRPHLVHHDLLFGEIATYYRVRSFIKPGITGLAQVRGLRGEARREKDLTDRILSDIYYLENWSPLLDWVIIGKTIRQMIVPPKTAF